MQTDKNNHQFNYDETSSRFYIRLSEKISLNEFKKNKT